MLKIDAHEKKNDVMIESFFHLKITLILSIGQKSDVATD